MSDLADELKRAAEANRILRREIEQLKKQLAAQTQHANEAPPSHGLSFRVSTKRCVSVYDLQSRPVSLYKDQWLRLASAMADIKQFIHEHDSELFTKAESREHLKAVPRLVRKRA